MTNDNRWGGHNLLLEGFSSGSVAHFPNGWQDIYRSGEALRGSHCREEYGPDKGRNSQSLIGDTISSSQFQNRKGYREVSIERLLAV